MYQLLARIGAHDLAWRQLPAFTASFLLASFFYRFGSFAVECVAFLLTWYVIDAGMQFASRFRIRGTAEVSDALHGRR